MTINTVNHETNGVPYWLTTESNISLQYEMISYFKGQVVTLVRAVKVKNHHWI